MNRTNKTKNHWFAQRRDLFVKKMVQEFYDTFSCFLTTYEQYIADNKLSFEDIERLVGSETEKGFLWRLKDRCHQLWRDEDPKNDLNGCLFDWIIGSIFHEAMKLKENIYMSQYYGPLADEMRNNHTASTVKFCGVECKRFMEKTSSEMNRQVENLGFMFGRANYLLRTMITNHADNPILLRFLFENEPVPEQLWSESLNEIFADMFGAPEKGFCETAKSYIQGQWHEKAVDAYKKALSINEKCEEAQNFIAEQTSFLEKPDLNSATMVS